MGYSDDLIPTLKQWATDAQTTFNNWPTMTAAQKDAATREVIRRLGILADNLARSLTHFSFYE